MHTHRVIILAAALLVGSVAGPASLRAQELARPSQELTRSPGDLGQPFATRPLSLQPGDVLRIDVWPDQSLGGQFTVEETGLVYLPFLGAVQVTGLSIDRLRTQLREGYTEVIKEPVVTITPMFRIGVMGAVARPGIYQVDPTNNVLDVLNMAGGFARDADPEEIRIIRPGERVIEYDVARAMEGNIDMDDLTLQSGDRIVVPQQGGGFSLRTAFEILRTATVTALLVERLVN